jgi:hypothetical protein
VPRHGKTAVRGEVGVSDKLDRVRTFAGFVEAGLVRLHAPTRWDDGDLLLDERGEIVPVESLPRVLVPAPDYAKIADRVYGPQWKRRIVDELVMVHPADLAATRHRLQERLLGYTPHQVIIDDPDWWPTSLERGDLLLRMRAVARGERLSLIGGAR